MFYICEEIQNIRQTKSSEQSSSSGKKKKK